MAQLVVFTSIWAPTLCAMSDSIDLRARFGYALRRALQERGMSQRELARRIGADPRHVARMLEGKSLPTIWESRDMAETLGVREGLFLDPPPVPEVPPEPYYPIRDYLVESADPPAPGPAPRRGPVRRARRSDATPRVFPDAETLGTRLREERRRSESSAPPPAPDSTPGERTG